MNDLEDDGIHKPKGGSIPAINDHKSKHSSMVKVTPSPPSSLGIRRAPLVLPEETPKRGFYDFDWQDVEHGSEVGR